VTAETRTRRPRKARVDDRNPFDTPAKRKAFAVAKQPYRCLRIRRGLILEYRRNESDGTWQAKIRVCGKYQRIRLGSADDFHAASDDILTFEQATEKAKKVAGQATVDDGATFAPWTVAEAVEAYEADLKRRGAEVYNARHPKKHLTKDLLKTPVMLLNAKVLSDWRDSLRTATTLADSSVDRILKGLRAALNLAAARDRLRVRNKAEWDEGLEAISEEIPARKAVLSDAKVGAFIAEGYTFDDEFGEFIDVCAQSGARPSQAARLLVHDLDDSDPERPQLYVPKSGKGGKRSRKTRMEQRYWVQISPELGKRLRARCAGRPDNALLLMKRGAPEMCRHLPGSSPALDPYRWASNDDWREQVRKIATRIGEDASLITIYSLRHSSITRQLLAGVPIGLVASVHDTSAQMIQDHYGRFIHQFGADRVREAMLKAVPTTPAIRLAR
jgi:hypothetical protein